MRDFHILLYNWSPYSWWQLVSISSIHWWPSWYKNAFSPRSLVCSASLWSEKNPEWALFTVQAVLSQNAWTSFMNEDSIFFSLHIILHFDKKIIMITATSTNLIVYLEVLGYNKWCHLVEFTALLACNPQLSPGHLISPQGGQGQLLLLQLILWKKVNTWYS